MKYIIGIDPLPANLSCDLGWVRDIVRQCRAAGVAPFVKQLGQRPTATDFQLEPLRYRHNHGGSIEEWPKDLRVREWPVRS